MNRLAQLQRTFLASMLDEAAPMPDEWDARREAGLTVYRNAYRARLVDVLRATFERTERLVGEDAFRQAAVHHLISHQPTSWTIDMTGAGFADTCSELFAADPDVGEIAWLEWSMQQAFTAADCEPLTITKFADATAHFTEQEWEALRLEFLPGIALRKVTHELSVLWNTLDGSSPVTAVRRLIAPAYALVWREAERPVFNVICEQEGRALSVLVNGGTFGEMCAKLADGVATSETALVVGTMLRSWLDIGAVCSIGVACCRKHCSRSSMETTAVQERRLGQLVGARNLVP